MRLLGVSAAVALVAGAGFAMAQGEQAPITADPALDALSKQPSELDELSKTPDDPFPLLEDSKARKPVSVTLRALDKITARYTDIEADIGKTVKFGSLEILPRFCDKRPPEEFPETTAFLEIFDRDLASARAAASVKVEGVDTAPEAASTDYTVEEIPELGSRQPQAQPAADAHVQPATMPTIANTPIDPDRIFSGWMFASSPALNALEHPVYDVWVIDCKTVVVDK